MERKKDSMKFYNTTASSYEELYGEEQQAKYIATLKAIGTSILGKVLDVGCGSATFLRIISSTTLRVGVDLSHRMLMSARAKNRDSMDLLCADADFLPFRDGSFDSTFTFTVFQNMPNPASTFREMLRVVRLDGLIVITVPNSELGRNALEVLKKASIPYRNLEVDLSSKDCIFVYRKTGTPL